MSIKIAIMHTKVIKCNRSYNRSQLQYSIKTLAIKILHKKVDNCGTKKLSNAVMQTKVINCNIANKSCLLQLVHTKAIAASTQFCDFYFTKRSAQKYKGNYYCHLDFLHFTLRIF